MVASGGHVPLLPPLGSGTVRYRKFNVKGFPVGDKYIMTTIDTTIHNTPIRAE